MQQKVQFIILGIALLFCGSTWAFHLSQGQSNEAVMTVTIYDVGQGSGAQVTSPTGTELFIDTGFGNTILRSLSQERNFFDRHINAILLSHFDGDHIGGTAELLKRYDVDQLIVTSLPPEDNTLAQEVLVVAEDEGTEITVIGAGAVLDLGGGVVAEVLWPGEGMSFSETNDSSFVMKVTYGETSVLFPGDVSKVVEDRLVTTYGDALESEILVLGHHGSRTSTSYRFVEATSPQTAIASFGKGNSFGHPHPEVVEVIESNNIPLLTTAVEGSMTFVSDGEIFVEKK